MVGGNSAIGQVLSNTTIGMQFEVHGSPCTFKEHDVFPSPPGGVLDVGPDPLQLYFNFFGEYNFILNLDPTTATIQSPQNPLQIPNIGCNGPPPNTCIGFFQWNAMAPAADTAPDPNSPR
jgi:hypothetical protein